jgi:hypothetical protein
LKSFHNLQLGASALYSNIISGEFEGRSVIETPPLISQFLSMLKLAVLISKFYLNLNIFKEFSNFY